MTYLMGKMSYFENVIIKHGFFPDTEQDINEKVAFINLYFDLYAPTLAALQYFWLGMSKGDFTHDYFSILLFDKYAFSKIKQAVYELVIESL